MGARQVVTLVSVHTGRAPGMTENDLWLLNEGNHSRLGEVLGAHPLVEQHGEVRGDEVVACSFGVWAPNARAVSVIGDWNGWRPGVDVLRGHGASGVWEGIAAEARPGDAYKFHLQTPNGVFEKADPVAFSAEQAPATASVVADLAYTWSDDEWMGRRAGTVALDAPISIYELHLGSWRHADDEHRSLNYREVAEPLADHMLALGFTHVELLPLMEHPFYGSWGYQTTGYFAPTSRFGSPQDLMYLIDHLHQRGIGVIFDWVPSHFPSDDHALARFDGTHLYEHEDPRLGFHPDWESLIFNYDRHEVRSFLLSSACHWLDRFHVDGLRVDAVASMLYLDYSRNDGEWIPNEHGGNENLGALRFLKRLNEVVYERFPDVQTIAEESTAWPMVSRPTSMGGLGFGLKWDMGWMHDTLEYFGEDPVHRRYHHDELTFRMVYAFTENYVLPLSHDEVVHGKGSLLARMPGDAWQQFANLRGLYGWMTAMPGKKLLFMGAELAQPSEWNHDHALPWHLLRDPAHAGIERWVAELNALYAREPGLHRGDCVPEGFSWVDASDTAASVLSLLRHDPSGQGRDVLAVANLTPVPRHGYRIGVPTGGRWVEVANSDGEAYGGTGVGNAAPLEASDEPMHGRAFSLELTLPPLGVLFAVPDATS